MFILGNDLTYIWMMCLLQNLTFCSKDHQDQRSHHSWGSDSPTPHQTHPLQSRNLARTREIWPRKVPSSFLPLPLALLPSFPPFLRFTPEEKAKRPALCHIPFGWGPRNCVGMRFALMEVKMALIDVLKKYSFVETPETEVSSLIIRFELILQLWVSTFYVVDVLNDHNHIAKEAMCSKFENILDVQTKERMNLRKALLYAKALHGS